MTALAIQLGGYFVLVMLCDSWSSLVGVLRQLFRFCSAALCGQDDVLQFASEQLPNEDEDVAEERKRVVLSCQMRSAGHADDDDSIKIVGLRQEYPAPWEPSGMKVAVQSLCLGVQPSSCLGLLGHNGAGKSTTFTMLSCELTPTKGDAYILGACVCDVASLHDVRAGRSVVQSPAETQRLIGVCPQFDALSPRLTGRETLRLFARLKGALFLFLCPSLCRSRVLCRYCQLRNRGHRAQADRNDGPDAIRREAGRRLLWRKQAQSQPGHCGTPLSVSFVVRCAAHACVRLQVIGNPQVILLDEPSTGMDPQAKRHLWDVIDKLREGRTIVLTTHRSVCLSCACANN